MLIPWRVHFQYGIPIDLHLPLLQGEGSTPNRYLTLGEPLPNGNFRATWEQNGGLQRESKQGSCHAVCHAGLIDWP